ncbi:MAG: GNAT family N-acetyltransferase [Clostridiales bacterium]|nr:GNAT family N-acetyltransferase [Clostridiales bacterium]
MDKSIMGHKSFLIPLEESDLEIVSNWACDPMVCKYYLNHDSMEEAYLEKILNNPLEDLRVFMINTVDNVSIGKLSLRILGDGNASVDMVIGEKVYVGKGYGKDALKAVIKYCFEELDLESIRMVIKEDSVRAESCCYSCGLKEDKYYIPDEDMGHTTRMVIFRKDYIGY